jgi:hypothetical protein
LCDVLRRRVDPIESRHQGGVLAREIGDRKLHVAVLEAAQLAYDAPAIPSARRTREAAAATGP